MSEEFAEIAIIGAGAAGLITAIAAARQNSSKFRILLLDSRQKIGAKILISGGTRCNVTNIRVTPQDYEGGTRHFIKHVLEAFTPEETIRFFESIGVKLILEPSGKYFPTTHSGKTVLEAFIKGIERHGVIFKTGIRITEIKKMGEFFHLKGCQADREENSFEIAARRVVLATGGLSYPETGSDGKGLEIAKKLGHLIVKTTPALTPLTTEDSDWKLLSGLTLNVRLSFFKAGKKEAERKGSFLFTHFGFSGPVALDISRFVAGLSQKEQPEIRASFLPRETEESLKKFFIEFSKQHPEKFIKSFLTDEFLLPLRFVEIFLKKTDFDERLTFKKCSSISRGRLIYSLLNYPLEVTGVVGYKKAEVTAGGVDLKEVKASTMESKIVPGLYFTGEILDIDGRIGGFNFQWAWSTGTIAGRSVMKNLGPA